jgi:hypothetical protein
MKDLRQLALGKLGKSFALAPIIHVEWQQFLP